MSTLTTAAGRPPLTYSLPGFHPDAYRAAPQWLESLRTLGFEWVTFHPTYPVANETPLRIGPGPLIEAAFQYARTLGFRIRMEPHLDWETMLSGGPYEWRRSMLLEPMRDYFGQVLAPLAALQPDELTLGSELDISAYEFADDWAEAAERLAPAGISLGHKLNHDWESVRGSGVRSLVPAGFGLRLRAYLRALDYVAISFYPPGAWELDARYTIGEFGLGSTDLARPWHFDASTFVTAEDFAVRRDYYLRFLEWLQTRTGRAACFWTAGHFDVLGIMHPEWRDDAIVEAVREYNQASP